MVVPLVNCIVPAGKHALPNVNDGEGLGLMVTTFVYTVLLHPVAVSTCSVTLNVPVDAYVCVCAVLVVAVCCTPSPKSQYHFTSDDDDVVDESVNVTTLLTHTGTETPNLEMGNGLTTI